MLKCEIKNAVREVLEETGLVSPFMTRGDVIAQIGRYRYNKAIKAGLLERNKAKGVYQNASVKIKRSAFVELVASGKI